MTPTVSFRRASSADEPFLRTTFIAGRPELAALPEALIGLQWRAQQGQYDRDFPSHVDHIIEVAGPVGHCWTWHGAAEHRLLDLVVLPDHRGHGIGRSVLIHLLDTAREAGVPLRLSVWHANEVALHLYRAVGLRTYHEQNGYLLMQSGETA